MIKILHILLLLTVITLGNEKPTLTIYTYDAFAVSWGPGPKIKEAFEKEEQENPEEIPQPETIEIPNLPVSESVVIEKEPMETLVTQSITPEIVNEPIIPKANLGKFIKQSDTVKLSPEEIKEYFDLNQQKPKPRASYTDRRSF